LIIKNLLRNAKRVYIDIPKAAQYHHDKKSVNIVKSEEWWYNCVDVCKYINFHWCSWFGYYSIIISIYFTGQSLINLVLMLSTSVLMGRNIWLARNEQFSGMIRMKKWWKFNRVVAVVIFCSKYLVVAWSYPVLSSWLAYDGVSNFANSYFPANGLFDNEAKSIGLELLAPSLSIFFSTLVLHRIRQVEYTVSHRTDIDNMDETDSARYGEIDDFGQDKNRASMSLGYPRSEISDDDMEQFAGTKYTNGIVDYSHFKMLKKKQYCKRVVMGENSMLEIPKNKTMIIIYKAFTNLHFMWAVLLWGIYMTSVTTFVVIS
jgi:hypothetical protein